MEETFSNGIFVGAVLPLAGYLIVHWLNASREKTARYAAACKDFRTTIIATTADIPEANEHWDNCVLMRIPEVVRKLEIAVAIFAYFLPGSKKKNLHKAWDEMKTLLEEEIPKALSAANILYGGGPMSAPNVKARFYRLKESMLASADQT